MVFYPSEERDSVANLKNLLIRTKTGQAIRIGQVAEIKLGEGLSTISRTDRKRTVNVTADIDPTKIQTGIVVSDIIDNYIPQLLQQYPDVEFDLGGSTKEENTLKSCLTITYKDFSRTFPDNPITCNSMLKASGSIWKEKHDFQGLRMSQKGISEFFLNRPIA